MEKRNTQPRIHYAVIFPACGAESHPGFSSAKQQSDGTYLLEFPIHIKGILKGKTTQKVWAEEKARHIRSWGVRPTVVEVSKI